MYAKAVYKPREPGITSVETLIQRDREDFARNVPGVRIEEVAPLTTADGKLLRSFTFFPGKEGNWERVSFGEEGDFFLVFALSSRSERAYRAATSDLSTTELTRELEAAVMAHAPPLVRGRRIRLRYAHQGGRNPPVIVIHGNQTDRVPEAYRRYLINRFRKAFKLKGTPVRLSFKTGDNPYKGKHNPLTPRQERRRKRMMRHVKKRK